MEFFWMLLSREIVGAKTFEMQNQILVDPRVANTHRSSFDIGQRHHRLVMEWTAFQRHQRQNFLSDHELYYYKAELTAMMLFGQLLNVKMTSMAGDSKKQSTAIPLHSVHNYGLGNLLASIAHHTTQCVCDVSKSKFDLNLRGENTKIEDVDQWFVEWNQ